MCWFQNYETKVCMEKKIISCHKSLTIPIAQMYKTKCTGTVSVLKLKSTVREKISTDLTLMQIGVVGSIAGMQVCKVPPQVCKDNLTLQCFDHTNIVTAARYFFIPFLVASH